MITKTFRFHGYGSLRFLYRKGSQVRSKYISLKFVTNPTRKQSRLAVVVSKKVSKKSPIRNRIRRRIYAVMEKRLLQIETSHDMVITVFDERVATIPFSELESMIDHLLAQSKIVK